MFCAVFWNIGGKTSRDGIVRLITALQREQNADLVLLAECSDGVLASAVRALNPIGQPIWDRLATRSRVQVLFRSDRMTTSEAAHHEYHSLIEVRRQGYVRLLVAGAHMVSRVHREFDHIDEELCALGRSIRETETRVGHSNTILLGDLNANPFDRGVVTATGLHAVMARQVAERNSRSVSHRDYPYFFNPMWKFFGDGTTEPPGTCYYPPEGAHRAFHWNTFDQVLIRPALLSHYEHDSVQIIHTLAGTPLTDSRWVPDRDVASDHLPVRVRLDC
jgi:hypothetical protein